MEKLLVIVGPTAVGKSDVALLLAKTLGAEIVSADSVQVYRGLDIGSAKPTVMERETVRHHLIDIVEPGVNYTVADYQADARRCIRDVLGRGKLPILAGGTGFYIRAVLRDYSFSEIGMNEEYRRKLRDEAEQFGAEHLHRRLTAVDPATAEKLHPNDNRRVIRALEVYEQSKRTISEQAAQTPEKMIYDATIVGLTMPRPLLYERIEKRVDRMMDAGLVSEVESLLSRGVSPEAKSMQSLGYRQIVSYLRGEISFAEAVMLIKQETRRYAKRQMTWFRREQEITWFDTMEAGGVIQTMENILYFLAGNYHRERE